MYDYKSSYINCDLALLIINICSRFSDKERRLKLPIKVFYCFLFITLSGSILENIWVSLFRMPGKKISME